MLGAGGVFLSVLLFSQNEVDALRYSQIKYAGTARSAAMSGAFGALGGDFSVLSINPAGIAIYRKSEFTFTPGFFIQNSNSDFKGNSLYDNKTNVNFSNAGLILSYYEPDSKNAWKGVTFGFGYNRLNNFNSSISMTGKNSQSSLLDVYLNDAINSGGDTSLMSPFGTQLALNTGAVFYDSATATYYHHLQGIYGEEQSKSITTGGSMGETVFTLGGNYDDKLYMGMTVGIPHIHYSEETNYTEKADSAYNTFKSFELNQSLKTTGVGFNIKFGMIYRPTDWIRIGGAFHSPTYFSMHDEYSSNMVTHFSNPNYYYPTAYSPAGSYDYSLVTPMRAIGSLGFVIQKKGLVGIDYEYTDYSSASLSSSKYKFLNENKAIRAKYVEGNIIRLGTEWRLAPMSIRAGAAYYTSPFRGETNIGTRMDYSAGIGFRDENFFLDFAYVYSQYSEKYFFYDPSLISASENTLHSSSVLMTLGFKF